MSLDQMRGRSAKSGSSVDRVMFPGAGRPALSLSLLNIKRTYSLL